MSYCRWSSDSFRCDVYVYGSDAGFITHVAGTRRVLADDAHAPSLQLLIDGKVNEWEAANKVWHQILESADSVPIDHPDAGQSFVDDTAGECADTLKRLAQQGFWVPEGVIDDLRAEQDEAPHGGPGRG